MNSSNVYKLKPDIDSLLDGGALWVAEPNGEREGYRSTEQAHESIPFGVEGLDLALPQGGLLRGAIHEVISEAPPHAITTILAKNALLNRSDNCKKLACWIGEESWPAAQFLRAVMGGVGRGLPQRNLIDKCLIEQCLIEQCHFISSPYISSPLSSSQHNKKSDQDSLFWSALSTLSAPGVAIVIAKIPNLSLQMSKRLALAAKRGNAVGILIREPSSVQMPSVAQSRWVIKPIRSPSSHPRYELELLKMKGPQPSRYTWQLELVNNYATISLSIPSKLVDRSCNVSTESGGERAELRYGTG